MRSSTDDEIIWLNRRFHRPRIEIDFDILRSELPLPLVVRTSALLIYSLAVYFPEAMANDRSFTRILSKGSSVTIPGTQIASHEGFLP